MSVAQAPNLQAPRAAGRRHTILVLDDEPDVARSLKDLLRLDYRVLTANSAKEALAMLEREEVHVIMTDQRMPEITGVEFLARVKGDHPDAIRLLFTGYADIRAVIDAINQGSVYRYITKPWDPDELQTIIREAMVRYDMIVERKQLLADLQAANNDLNAANRAKEAFIRVASHELRTPLAILMGLLQLAERAPGGASREIVAKLHRSADRLQHLVDQITKMLAAGQYTIPMQARETAVGDVLNLAAADVMPFVELRKQTLSVEVADSAGMALLDEMQIRDCVHQLLMNAIKFTPDGGKIRLQASGHAEQVEITVTDSGEGIPHDHLANLFEPFFTGFDVSLHSSGQYEYKRKGLGLGLAMVKAFVDMHHGTIRAESELSKGTKVTILLPRR